MNQQTSFRPYSPEDASTIYDLTARSAELDRVDPRSTLESVPTFEELAESLENDGGDVLVGVDNEGNIVGYGQIRWWQEEDGTLVYLHSGMVDPDHRRKGHGSALLGALEAKIHEIAATHDKDAPKVMGANSSDAEPIKTAMLEKQGYGLVHSMVEMEFVQPEKLPDAQLPEGFTLRESATPEEQRQIYEANKRIYEGTFGSVAPSEENFEEFLEDIPEDANWKVVWHEDELAGFVISTHKDNGAAEIMEVAVLPEFRRQGLAGFLMAESIRSLQTEGAELIRLHTDADGKMGGRQLYENIGFKALKEHGRYRKPISLEQEAHSDQVNLTEMTEDQLSEWFNPNNIHNGSHFMSPEDNARFQQRCDSDLKEGIRFLRERWGEYADREFIESFALVHWVGNSENGLDNLERLLGDSRHEVEISTQGYRDAEALIGNTRWLNAKFGVLVDGRVNLASNADIQTNQWHGLMPDDDVKRRKYTEWANRLMTNETNCISPYEFAVDNWKASAIVVDPDTPNMDLVVAMAKKYGLSVVDTSNNTLFESNKSSQ